MRKIWIKTVLIVVSVALLFSSSIYFFGFYLPEKREREENERLIKEYYENKLVTYAEENALYGEYEVDVAFLGDSLTDGYDLNTYYPQSTTANRGIGGDTTHGLESRLEVSLYDLKPKIAVILIGGNNLDTMFENYERMICSIREKLPETKIILCSLTAMGRNFAQKNEIACYNNVIIKKLADKYECEFVDLYTPLFDISIQEIYADYTSDGVHFTNEGYRVFTDTLTPVIEKLME